MTKPLSVPRAKVRTKTHNYPVGTHDEPIENALHLERVEHTLGPPYKHLAKYGVKTSDPVRGIGSPIVEPLRSGHDAIGVDTSRETSLPVENKRSGNVSPARVDTCDPVPLEFPDVRARRSDLTNYSDSTNDAVKIPKRAHNLSRLGGAPAPDANISHKYENASGDNIPAPDEDEPPSLRDNEHSGNGKARSTSDTPPCKGKSHERHLEDPRE